MGIKIATSIEPTPKDSAQRACVRQFDRDGNLVVRTYGPSPRELQEAHDNGTCDMWCELCYEEAYAKGEVL